MASDLSALLVHCNAREVSNMLVGSSKLIEEGGLSAVLVSSQGEGYGLCFRKRSLSLLFMILSFLSQTWMLLGITEEGTLRLFLRLNFFTLYFLGIIFSYGKLIAMDHELHGVPHGGKLGKGTDCIWNQSHIEKMLSQGSRSSDTDYSGAFARF